MNNHVKMFEDFSQSEDVKTVRDLVEQHPELWDFDYKKEDATIDIVLSEYGYKLKDDSLVGEYNDLKGYLDAEIEPLEEDNFSKKLDEVILHAGRKPTGVDIRDQNGQMVIYYNGKNPLANKWVEKIKNKFDGIVFTDTSKMR